MRRSKRKLLAWVVAGSFFILKAAYSANTDIIINEIGTYPPRTKEWIEVWNRGNETVDLKDWIFWEKFSGADKEVNHGLSATGTSDGKVAPGAFAVIVENATDFKIDNPNFAGLIFDSAWSKGLSEESRVIGLKDNLGNVIEQFTYLPTSRFSLERKSPYVSDYTSDNWQEHPSGNSIGATNTVFSAAGKEAFDALSVSSTTEAATNSQSGAPAGAVWPGIKINEVMPDPETGAEWIELFNTATTSLDLTGGTLCDGRAAPECLIASPTSTILAGGWLTIYLPSAKLNNSGDTVILKNPSGEDMDRIAYGSGAVALPKKGQSVARAQDGVDSGDDAVDWAITTVPTPNAANKIVAPVVIEGGGIASGSGQSIPYTDTSAAKTVKNATTTNSAPSSASPIVFNEIFPNPEGADTAVEFLELKNTSATTTVSLSGWRIENSSGQKFAIASTTSLGPGKIQAWKRASGLFALKNSTENFSLFSEQGARVANLSYDIAPEGQSYNRLANGNWAWSTTPTFGEENRIAKPESVKIMWHLQAPLKGVVEHPLLFVAASSTDPRGGSFFFTWNFGDGQSEDGGRVSHTFEKAGTYAVTIFATSSAGTVGQKIVTVKIAAESGTNPAGIIVSEVFPNPAGADENEFIEIFNAGSTSTAVAGWSLSSGDKKFIIPEDTVIKPGGFLVFKTAATNLTLSNQSGSLSLYDENEELIDQAEYAEAKENKSYSLGPQGKWAWVESTPGFVLDAEAWQKQAAEGEKKPVSKKSASTKTSKPVSSSAGVIKTVTGIVTSAPGALGSQYFYLAAAQGGIQIFQSKKNFPDVRVGDEVSATGRLHMVSGVARLTIAGANAIDILDSEKFLAPEPITSLQLPQALNGSLVSIKGEITELKSTHLYIDDGKGEVLVYFKSGAGINSKGLHLGQVVRVNGIVERTNKKEQILPRSMEDVEVVQKSEPTKIVAKAVPADEPYVPVTVGGIATVVFGALARYRGMAVKNAFKKVAQLAAGIFKNNA